MIVAVNYLSWGLLVGGCKRPLISKKGLLLFYKDLYIGKHDGNFYFFN